MPTRGRGRGTKRKNRRTRRCGGAGKAVNPGLKLEKAAAAATKKLGTVQKRVTAARTRVNTLQGQMSKAEATLTKALRELEDVENKAQNAQKAYNQHRATRHFSPKIRQIKSPHTA